MAFFVRLASQATAIAGNQEPPEDGQTPNRGWTNKFFLDGVEIHRCAGDGHSFLAPLERTRGLGMVAVAGADAFARTG